MSAAEDDLIPEFTKDIDPLVEKALTDLMEHCDAVQIFVSRHDHASDNTVRLSKGKGNWFTRYGQVNTWVEFQRGYHQKQGADDAGEDDPSE